MCSSGPAPHQQVEKKTMEQEQQQEVEKSKKGRKKQQQGKRRRRGGGSKEDEEQNRETRRQRGKAPLSDRPARRAASLMRLARSAPVKPVVLAAMLSTVTSSPRGRPCFWM